MTLHAALAIGAPMVWTRTEGSVQSSPTSRAYSPLHPDRQLLRLVERQIMTLRATLAIGAPMVWTHTEGSVQASPTSRVPTLLTRGVWVSGPMPAWRVPAGREQRADDVDVLALAAACSAELDAGTWSSTLTRRNRLHVDVGAWRGAGVAEVRPSVALLCLREGARVATAREGAAGRRLGEVGQLAVVALARSSRARTRRRSSRSCPATDTTGVIRMRAAWLVELQVLRGYGRPEACVAHSR